MGGIGAALSTGVLIVCTHRLPPGVGRTWAISYLKPDVVFRRACIISQRNTVSRLIHVHLGGGALFACLYVCKVPDFNAVIAFRLQTPARGQSLAGGAYSGAGGPPSILTCGNRCILPPPPLDR